jgi:hypothetical protein
LLADAANDDKAADAAHDDKQARSDAWPTIDASTIARVDKKFWFQAMWH